MALDRRYFASQGDERPEADHGEVDWDYFESYVAPLCKKVGGSILELGCGHGFVSERLAQEESVSRVVAIDKIADFWKKHPKIEYRTQDITAEDDFGSGFDCVVTTEFVEHISEDAFHGLIPKVVAALKPEGVFLGSTPRNPTPYKTFSGSRFHVREYNKKDLEALLREYFRDVAVSPVSEYCLIWEAKHPKNKAARETV